MIGNRIKWDWELIIIGTVVALVVFFFVVSISFAQPTSSTISPKAFGSKSWRENGLAPASLPLTNNVLWDVRLASDGVIYYWDGNSWESIVGSGGGGTLTIEVGTTTTGLPGTQASVVNSGTETDLILDFTIPRGNTGAAGTNGIDGIDGEDGDTGPAGAAATIAVGDTTTGLAGSSASVTNVGTSNAAIFDFVIPRGNTGATGATGATGETGSIGPQGPPGPIAGSNTQIIFNDSGSAAGDADFTFNKTTNKLTSGLHQITLSGDGQVLQAGGTTSSFPGFYRVGSRLDLNLADDGGMSGLGVDVVLGGSNHSMVSNTPSFRLNSNGGGLLELSSSGGIEWSSTSDARANEGTKIMRGGEGVAKFTDALSLTPRVSPPVTCGSAGSESVMYYDTSHALCICGTSTWHNLTSTDGGSCS